MADIEYLKAWARRTGYKEFDRFLCGTASFEDCAMDVIENLAEPGDYDEEHENNCDHRIACDEIREAIQDNKDVAKAARAAIAALDSENTTGTHPIAAATAPTIP